MSYLLTQQNMMAAQKPFLPPTIVAGGGSFLVQESDGTSRFDLEADVNDEILLEV